MTLLEISLFFIVPAIAAAINSVAGGGTFLTFPVFIMGGLTPLQANVMSTIALWPGTISSSYGYRKVLSTSYKSLLPLFIICIIGGTLGSVTLLNTSEVVFKKLVPWLLLIATLIFTFGKYGVALLHKYFPNGKKQQGLAFCIQSLISFYGGYFGAGIGILMLAMLQIMGYSNIHQMNAIKILLGAAINLATVIIFICAGAVIWNLAAIMIAGGVFGGYAGTRLALKVSPERIRILVSIIGFSMSAYFFLSVV
ncbi:MAG: sulfite exporter TauE/SafE family protein [Pseudomonadota bacterium]